jgi:hypothetical protein
LTSFVRVSYQSVQYSYCTDANSKHPKKSERETLT